MPIQFHGYSSEVQEWLERLIESSPMLKDQLAQADAKGAVTGIRNQGEVGEAACYVPGQKEIRIALSDIEDNRKFGVVNSIAHETSHALRWKDVSANVKAIDETIEAISRSKAQVHDYTHALKSYIDVYREDEARAVISGWNAAVDSMSASNGKDPTFKEACQAVGRNGWGPLALMDDFNRPQSPLPGIGIDERMRIDQGDANTVARVGMQYFSGDIRPSHLGEYDTDYPHYYLLPKISQIMDKYSGGFSGEDDGSDKTVRIDLSLIGIDPSPLDKKGALDFGMGVGDLKDGTSKLFKDALRLVEDNQDGLVPAHWSGEEARTLAANFAKQAEKCGLSDIAGIHASQVDRNQLYVTDSTKQHRTDLVDLSAMKPLNDFIAQPKFEQPEQPEKSRCVIF